MSELFPDVSEDAVDRAELRMNIDRLMQGPVAEYRPAPLTGVYPPIPKDAS